MTREHVEYVPSRYLAALVTDGRHSTPRTGKLGSSPMKSSVRDLLLVTVIVALAVAWWLDRTRLADC